MSTESMRRGAHEANKESERLRLSRDMGEAIGKQAVFAKAITDLMARVEVLETQVSELNGRTGGMVRLGGSDGR